MDTMKTLPAGQGAWDAQYPALLRECAEGLSYHNYMKILEKEHEEELLLEQLKLHPDQIYEYGGFLAKSYPSEVCAIFIIDIEKKAEAADNRKMYLHVCRQIQSFSQAGFAAQASSLITDLKIKYKHKPAFNDELCKLTKNGL